MEDPTAEVTRADEAERRVIAEVRRLGNEALCCWAAQHEATQQARVGQQGRARAGKKLYWYTTFGEISVVEQLFWQEGYVLRPFCRSAGVSCRGYSQPLQRRMTDFGADLAFGQVPAKLKEHYGIEVPGSAVRTITEAHASHIHAQEHL